MAIPSPGVPGFGPGSQRPDASLGVGGAALGSAVRLVAGREWPVRRPRRRRSAQVLVSLAAAAARYAAPGRRPEMQRIRAEQAARDRSVGPIRADRAPIMWSTTRPGPRSRRRGKAPDRYIDPYLGALAWPRTPQGNDVPDRRDTASEGVGLLVALWPPSARPGSTSIVMDLLDGQNGPPQPVERRPRRAGGSSAEVIVHVVGEIDICTEPALTRCLAAQLQPTRHLTSLVVDLSSVTYVGVRGFAALLTAATNATTATPPPQRRVLPGRPQPAGSSTPRRHRPGPHPDCPRRRAGHAGRPSSSGYGRTRHRSEIRSQRDKR
ncbi:MAG: hypothetical protein K0R62_7304 [Nonomuraea muscovyensis]|nr:hypothetical protein [Nonomuraea muscovyensis]